LMGVGLAVDCAPRLLQALRAPVAAAGPVESRTLSPVVSDSGDRERVTEAPA
jgi:hypothetical protein